MAIANSPASPAQTAQVQLHDIHIPEQISNLPIALGWWILLALMIFSAFIFYKKYQQRIRLNASKKQALSVLDSHHDINAKECLSLLKWAALQYLERKSLANLYGLALQKTLLDFLPEKHQSSFIALTTDAFQTQYQADNTHNAETDDAVIKMNKDCQQAVKLWLTHALPIVKDKELS